MQTVGDGQRAILRRGSGGLGDGEPACIIGRDIAVVRSDFRLAFKHIVAARERQGEGERLSVSDLR